MRKNFEIKKLQNTTSRQITYSKRKKGLLKKSYELAIFCDVDVAFISFSPSGKLTLFTANKSVEDILERVINLPDHIRRWPKEDLQRSLEKMKYDNYEASQLESDSDESTIKNLQYEILKARSELEDVEKRLSCYEEDHTRISSLKVTEYKKQLLQDTLYRVPSLQSQQPMDGNYNSSNVQPTTQEENNANSHGFVADGSQTQNYIWDWIQPNDPQPQFMNVFYSNEFLPMRDQANPIGDFIPPAQTPIHGNNMDLTAAHMDWIQPNDPQPQFMNAFDSNEFLPMRNQANPISDFISPTQAPIHGNNMDLTAAHSGPISGVAIDNQAHHEVFGDDNANPSQWTGHYSTEVGGFRFEEPGGDSLLDLLMSEQYSP